MPRYHIDLDCLRSFVDSVKTDDRPLTASGSVSNLEVRFHGRIYRLSETDYRKEAERLAKDVAAYYNRPIWQAQLSDGWLPVFRASSVVAYPLGSAKMKRLPKAGELVEVLSRKHILYRGEIIGDVSGRMVLNLVPVTPPVYTGKFFRRNWTLKKVV